MMMKDHIHIANDTVDLIEELQTDAESTSYIPLTRIYTLYNDVMHCILTFLAKRDIIAIACVNKKWNRATETLACQGWLIDNDRYTSLLLNSHTSTLRNHVVEL
jgi:hypothetical protein